MLPHHHWCQGFSLKRDELTVFSFLDVCAVQLPPVESHPQDVINGGEDVDQFDRIGVFLALEGRLGVVDDERHVGGFVE